ncbi:hypothetical protein TCAL_00452 [Tigriopus californicus]|uniref:Small RNA 2'-O-methyltransferase n=2 Tax=Tigriopus californicus TaxID=6832 RepID=A0A553NF81_TIGCA|nr:small RNA 2'-O-methyltransferase-like isoform X1 [Tigriopus californicus]TRY64107.1 hypothetical protein TCAL_00452 [Tigriopus californicus]
MPSHAQSRRITPEPAGEEGPPLIPDNVPDPPEDEGPAWHIVLDHEGHGVGPDLMGGDRLSLSSEHGREGDFKFSPSLYAQRYDAALDILNKPEWAMGMKKVVDFGCSEWQFFCRLKQLKYTREVVGVDVDEELLRRIRRKIRPFAMDYIQPRTYCPLDVFLMAGSMVDYDTRLQNVDAITAIEVIEHLHPEVLAQVPANIFGRLQPKLAIFTTPNSEFNVLFPNFEGPFRHWDHKFEWTRAEFRDWCHDITDTYPNYSVVFSGVGFGHSDSALTLGPCSQIATFVRQDFEEMSRNGLFLDLSAEDGLLIDDIAQANLTQPMPYEVIEKETYVFKADNRTVHEKILDACQGHFNSVMYNIDYAYVRMEENEGNPDFDPYLYTFSIQSLIEACDLQQMEDISPELVKSSLVSEGYQVDNEYTVQVRKTPWPDSDENDDEDDELEQPEPNEEQFQDPVEIVEEESWD